MDESVFTRLPALRESTEGMIRDMIPVIIWYRSNRKGKEYWCNRCGAHGFVEKTARTQTPAERMLLYSGHKSDGACPECGRRGELACIGRVRGHRRYSTYRWAMVVQPMSENEVWIRETEITYNPGFWNTEKGIHETLPQAMPQIRDHARYHLIPGCVQQYERNYYSGTWTKTDEIRDVTRARYQWHTEGYNAEMVSRMLVEGDLTDTFLRYNSWDHRSGYTGGVNIACYLANYAMYPSIEMMMKAGFCGIVYDLVVCRKKNSSCVDWSQTDPRKAFGMSKSDLEKLKKHSAQPQMLQEYHRYKRRGERDPWECAEMIWRWRPTYGVKEWRDTLRKCGAAEIELYRYFEKIREENPGCHMAMPPRVDTTWRDYIQAAKQIGYDLTQRTVVMPRDLYGKHDEAVALKNEMFPPRVYNYTYPAVKTTEEMREKFAKRTEDLTKKYAKTDAQYFIRIPQTPDEIIAEGQALSHCVGGYNYITNHANGRNPIIFLRRTSDPETPFYTIEVDVKTNRILQCEGCKSEDGHGKYGHIHREDLPEEAKAFLDAWENERVKKDTTEKETKTA